MVLESFDYNLINYHLISELQRVRKFYSVENSSPRLVGYLYWKNLPAFQAFGTQILGTGDQIKFKSKRNC